MKKQIKFFLKLFFGLAILIYLFSKISFQEFWHFLYNAKYEYFIIALSLYILGQIISAKKWMLLSEYLHFNYTFFEYIKFYFLGMFYNMFLPTNIGGDFVKIAKLKDNKKNCIIRGIISVFSDRITGVFVLILFILSGFLFYNKLIWLNVINILIIISSLICILIFIYLIKNEQIIPKKVKIFFYYTKLLCSKTCIIKIITISILFHTLLVLIHFCIAQMYNFNIPLTYYLILYPITAITASLPLSINGIGLKEFVYVYMLKLFHIDASGAILFAMTFNMVVFFASTIGFFPFITETKNFDEDTCNT